jgi:hypothetical protein
MTIALKSPGVQRTDIFLKPPVALATGVPGFVGFAGPKKDAATTIKPGEPFGIHRKRELEDNFVCDGFLNEAVAAFFDNGGKRCYIAGTTGLGEAALSVAIDRLPSALSVAIDTLASVADLDLVVVPDAMMLGARRTTTGGIEWPLDRVFAGREEATQALAWLYSNPDNVDLVLAGRNEEATQALAWLYGNPDNVAVQAESFQEGRLFLIALLERRLPDEVRMRYLTRLLFASGPEEARAFGFAPAPMIICLENADTDLARSLVGQGHHVYSIFGSAERVIHLPRRKTSRDAILRVQRHAVAHCAVHGDRFAILDALPGSDDKALLKQRDAILFGQAEPVNAALYFPWLWTVGGKLVPPSGAVAGVFARTDARAGVHKAPANEEVAEVFDLETDVNTAIQDRINPKGINCLRAFSGRGIRVWGARTISRDPAWRYINVRRLVLTLQRWIALNLAWAGFEPNGPLLWVRIERELSGYLTRLWLAGALSGGTPDAAFYVKCDAETNPPERRDNGEIVTEIGLGPNPPAEFVVIRISQREGAAQLLAI